MDITSEDREDVKRTDHAFDYLYFSRFSRLRVPDRGKSSVNSVE